VRSLISYHPCWFFVHITGPEFLEIRVRVGIVALTGRLETSIAISCDGHIRQRVWQR
jgi:hypothetical protein